MFNLSAIPAVYLDMDGTIANFYGVPGWLEYLQAEDTTPYEVAAPLVNFSLLARYLHKLQACGVAVGIVSWTSKSGSEDFHKQVVDAKMEYLRRHLPSVEWDEIYIVPYGTPKYEVVKNPDGVLFDDESRNRVDWRGVAFGEDNLIEILKALLKAREVQPPRTGKENRMIFIAIICIIAALLYCVTATIVGWMTWRDTRDWHFLAGTCFYIVAAVLITVWLLGNCA